MPQIIRCPECNRQLRVPDNFLGKKVRCPSCKTTFAAAEAPNFKPVDESPPAPRPRPAPAPEEHYEEPPRPQRPRQAAPPSEEPDFEGAAEDEEERRAERRPRRRRGRGGDSAAGWQKVRLGLTLILIGIGVGIVAGLIWVVGGILTSALAGSGATTTVGPQSTNVRPSSGAGVLAIVLVILPIVMALASRGLTVAGYGFCLPVPRASGAGMLAKTTLILGIVNTIMPLISCIVVYVVIGAIAFAAFGGGARGAVAGAGIVVFILGAVVAVLFLSETIAFLQFLRTISLHLRAEGLARSIMYLMILFVVIIALALVMVLISLLGGAIGTVEAATALGLAILGCGCINTLLALAWFVWYVITLFFVRSTVSSHIVH